MSESESDLLCPVCLREASSKGVLDNGDHIYVHGSTHCFHDPGEGGEDGAR